jgi:hypothetical protein
LEKYELVKSAIIHCLQGTAGIPHKELFTRITAYFQKNKLEFSGSLEWYMEGVKLDLEAQGILNRIKEKQRFLFCLTPSPSN